MGVGWGVGGNESCSSLRSGDVVWIHEGAYVPYTNACIQ